MATKGKSNGKGNVDAVQIKPNLGKLFALEIPTRIIALATLYAAWVAETANEAWAKVWGERCPEAPGKSKRAAQRAMAWIGLRGENPDERIVEGVLRLPLDPMRDEAGDLLRDPTTGRVLGHVVTVVDLDAKGKAAHGIAEGALAWALYRGDRKAADTLPLMQVVSYTSTHGLECKTDYLKAEISKAFEDFASNPTDADLRPVIVDMVASCMPLYVKGRTVQFVGHEHMDTLSACVRILKACGAITFVGEMADTPEGRDSLIEAFMREMDDEFNAMQRAIDADAGDEDRDVREKTFVKHEKSLTDLAAQVDYYTGLLGIASDHLKARLDAQRQTVIDSLTGIRASKANKPASTGKGKGKTPTRQCPACNAKLTGAALVSAKFCAACGKPLPPLVSVADDTAQANTPPQAPAPEAPVATADAADPLA